MQNAEFGIRSCDLAETLKAPLGAAVRETQASLTEEAL